MRGLREHLAPLFEPEVAHHACGARSILGANHGEDKMQIGVRPFVRHGTSGASATGLLFLTMLLRCFTQQQARKVERHRHVSSTFRTIEEDGMRQTPRAPLALHFGIWPSHVDKIMEIYLTSTSLISHVPALVAVLV